MNFSLKNKSIYTLFFENHIVFVNTCNNRDKYIKYVFFMKKTVLNDAFYTIGLIQFYFLTS
jgi:hypothetical protein